MKALVFSNTQEASNFTKANINKGFVLFSDVEKVLEMSKLVSSNVTLCSTAGEYGRDGYRNGIISGFEYELPDAEVVEILYPPIKSINNSRLRNSASIDFPNFFQVRYLYFPPVCQNINNNKNKKQMEVK